MIPWLNELLQRPSLSIEWWDVLDIAIVSFLIYELLLLIRGTRAVRISYERGSSLPIEVATELAGEGIFAGLAAHFHGMFGDLHAKHTIKKFPDRLPAARPLV